MRRTPLISALILALLFPLPDSGRSDAVPIPPNVPVSGPQPGLQNEEQVWICPKDTHIVVTNHRDFRLGYRQIGIGRSPTGGSFWIDSLIHPDYQIFTHQSDPIMTVNSSGDIFICHLDYRRDITPSDSSYIAFLVSSDCGETWNGPYTVEDSIGPYFEDKQFMTCDRSGGPYDGNIYISWTRFDYPTRIMFARSTNSAVDWDDTLIVGTPHYLSCLDWTLDAGQFSQPLVGKDGAVYVFWVGYDIDTLGGNCDWLTSIVVNKSTDGGVTWEGERRLFSVDGWSGVDGGINVYSQPTTDADLTNGPHAGNLYLQYRDTVTTSSWESDILFRRSLDTGHTWSAPIRVNDDPIGPDVDQFHNWMICNNEGVLVSVWYDQRTDPAHYMFDVFAGYSFDGGASWTSNHRVSSVSISPDFLASTSASEPIGPAAPLVPLEVQSPQAGLIAEYIGVSCIDEKVVAVWTDTRDATGPGDQDVYAAYWYLPLTVPRLLYPQPGDWVDQLQTPGFDWSTCWKEDADAYRLQIADDPSFNTPLIQEWCDSSGYNGSIEILPDNHEYFWRVKAYKKDGEALVDSTEYSEVWDFTIPIIECFCWNQSDFDYDGFITALDMGSLIDILFAGDPDVQDPFCVTTLGDFDCDGFTTSLDLAGLIDHLFAAGPPPCDPCGI
jgi:hypothetical protein